MKKKYYWQIFLSFFVLFLATILICFLFCHFKNKPVKIIEKNPSTTTENQGNNNPPPKGRNWKSNIDYQPVQPTQKEPEYQDKLLPISSAGTEYKKSVVEVNILPRGSAILTGSGDLEKQGIKAIIHACPGSIKKKGENFQATIQGVIRSVQNAILLAEKNNYKSIAFCLVGSNCLDNIISPNQGTKKERQKKLAETIIKSAVEQRKSLEKIVFVDFGNTAFNEASSRIREDYPGEIMKNTHTARGIIIAGKDKGKKKGITDYSLHKCEVIVNSLNMEGEFISSGSFSGFIAGKTGSEKNKIQKEIKKNITEFNKRLKNKSI